MPQLLPLSRAARLVGISRGELQSRIRHNELEAFEGMVKVSDLLRVFPETRLQDDSALERAERIKANAAPRTDINPKLPSAPVLARRVTELSRDLTESRDLMNHYGEVISQLEARLNDLRATDPATLPDEIDGLYLWLQDSMHKQPKVPRRKTEILARDTFLRMVEAQVKLIPSGDEYFVQGADTLLESGLRSGIPLRYGCTHGSCSKCKARVISGEVLKVRDHEYRISDAEHDLGYILMCSYTAVTDLVIEADVARDSHDIPEQDIQTEVFRFERLNDDVAILILKTPGTYSLRFLSGQNVSLSLPMGETQSFPIASCPCDGSQLELHLYRHQDLPISRQILDHGIPVKTAIRLTGPKGDFILDPNSDRPVIFMAWNEGFAPIKSLVEGAISIDKAEHLHLYWMADRPEMLYLDNRCRSWHDALDNFDYTPILFETLEGDKTLTVLENSITELTNIKDYDIYIAAPSSIVQLLKQILLQAGLKEDRINLMYTDSLDG